MKLPTLPISSPLLAWLKTDTLWPQLDWRLRALLTWRAKLGSLNAGLSQQQANPPQNMRPLFIAGPWRSGSTVMHELLAAALGWSTPLTWQCMDPTAFRLKNGPQQATSVARPMDGLQLGPLSPQEDEFALLGLGADSAYRAFWQPSRLQQLHHTLDPAHWLASDEWLSTWESFARGVQASASPGLLLKSPNHSFRLAAFVRRFPDAQVVWMLRDAREVLLSNQKMWQQMFALHGLSEPLPGALDRFLEAALRRTAEVLDWACATLPKHQLALCWQPALRDAPEAELRRVLHALDLPFASEVASFQQAVAKSAEGRVESYPTQPLPDALQAAVDQLNTAQALAQHRAKAR